jgi:GTP-binding protein HflX
MVITAELVRYLTELSHEAGRQIGILADRKGVIQFVIVGSEKELLIPDLSDFRLGRKRLRGVRLIHTHLKDEPLSQDDLTDLAMLRLDMIAAIGVLENGLPGNIYTAHLLPPNPDKKIYQVDEPLPFHRYDLNFQEFVYSLEDELSKKAIGYDVRDKRERAILISASTKGKAEQEESLEELKELARSDELVVLDTIVQRPHQINPKYLLGSGKIKELIIISLQLGADIIIFDQNLSPAQVKALGEITELKVIDRTQLILDIFARRAHSREGKVQVELAQLKYLLPKLSERSTALSRLTGGIGGRGPGETRLEVDRRRVKDRIYNLEKELESLNKGRSQRRSRRREAKIPIVSIVGYTNAGKSTLLNALTNSSVLTQNLLFATLDTSTRRLRFPKEREVIITDTVGFIKDLPKDLLTAFLPTLDELKDADLLLHIVDISNPRFEQQIEDVNKILASLELDKIPQLVVFNKKDRIEPKLAKAVAKRYKGVAISALETATLPELLNAMEVYLWKAEPSHLQPQAPEDTQLQD